MSETIHTTRSAADYLRQRYGLEVQPQTVKQWCNRRKLPGAYRVGTGRRAIWQVPESALDMIGVKGSGQSPKGQGDTEAISGSEIV